MIEDSSGERDLPVETRFEHQSVDALTYALIVGSLALAMVAIGLAVRLLVG